MHLNFDCWSWGSREVKNELSPLVGQLSTVGNLENESFSVV